MNMCEFSRDRYPSLRSSPAAKRCAPMLSKTAAQWLKSLLREAWLTLPAACSALASWCSSRTSSISWR